MSGRSHSAGLACRDSLAGDAEVGATDVATTVMTGSKRAEKRVDADEASPARTGSGGRYFRR